MNDDERIFVSIAAYRDPQLVPTVEDCIAKARFPERLRFGICWQHAVGDPPLTLAEDARVCVLDVDWRQSRGACWARAEVMKLWAGEEWFMQVDSHCRFAEGWDETLLRTMVQTGSEKPVLSTYGTPFTPGPNEALFGEPLQMVFQAFTEDGIAQIRPGVLPRESGSSRPLRARFVAAGFLFAQGRFVQEVPYDPELYFMGEESAMTVRAFTHGYDLFHPAETVVWHDYVRADAKKHWGDHTEAEVGAGHWGDLDGHSRRKVQRLLLGERVESFGLGTVRTLAEYEAYSGLSFELRKAQQGTVRGMEPPNADASPDWAERIYPWIARIRVMREQLPEGSLDDAGLWSLSIQDEEGFEVCRRDLTADELSPLQGAGEGIAEEIAVICEFDSETVPVAWTLLPLSRSKGWLRRIDGRLLEGDYAILKEEAE